MNKLDFIDLSMHHLNVQSCNPFHHNNLLLLIKAGTIFLYVKLSYTIYLRDQIIIEYLHELVFSFMDIFEESNHIGSLHLPILFFN